MKPLVPNNPNDIAQSGRAKARRLGIPTEYVSAPKLPTNKPISSNTMPSTVVKIASKNIASKIIRGNNSLSTSATVAPIKPTTSTLSKAQGTVVPPLTKNANVLNVARKGFKAVTNAVGDVVNRISGKPNTPISRPLTGVDDIMANTRSSSRVSRSSRTTTVDNRAAYNSKYTSNAAPKGDRGVIRTVDNRPAANKVTPVNERGVTRTVDNRAPSSQPTPVNERGVIRTVDNRTIGEISGNPPRQPRPERMRRIATANSEGKVVPVASTNAPALPPVAANVQPMPAGVSNTQLMPPGQRNTNITSRRVSENSTMSNEIIPRTSFSNMSPDQQPAYIRRLAADKANPPGSSVPATTTSTSGAPAATSTDSPTNSKGGLGIKALLAAGGIGIGGGALGTTAINNRRRTRDDYYGNY